MRYPKKGIAFHLGSLLPVIRTGAGKKAEAGWGLPLSSGLSSFTVDGFLSGAKKGKVRPSVFFCPWQERRKNNLSIFINRYTVVWSKVQVCVAPGTAAILRDQGVTGQGGEKNRWKKTGTYRRPGVYAFTGE